MFSMCAFPLATICEMYPLMVLLVTLNGWNVALTSAANAVKCSSTVVCFKKKSQYSALQNEHYSVLIVIWIFSAFQTQSYKVHNGDINLTHKISFQQLFETNHRFSWSAAPKSYKLNSVVVSSFKITVKRPWSAAGHHFLSWMERQHKHNFLTDSALGPDLFPNKSLQSAVFHEVTFADSEYILYSVQLQYIIFYLLTSVSNVHWLMQNSV